MFLKALLPKVLKAKEPLVYGYFVSNNVVKLQKKKKPSKIWSSYTE